jgi:hypothetical protein
MTIGVLRCDELLKNDIQTKQNVLLVIKPSNNTGNSTKNHIYQRVDNFCRRFLSLASADLQRVNISGDGRSALIIETFQV